MGDIYQAITDRILDSLEQGVLPGVGRPWDSSSRTPLIPRNAVSGRQYNGINVPLLWDMAEKRGFSQDRWLTFRQAKEAGCTVRKGERSTLACFYKPMKREIVDDAGEPVLDEEGNPKEKHFAILRGFNLFNIDQCDGLPDEITNPPPTAVEGFDSVDALDDFIGGCGIKVVHSLDREIAGYYPKQDRVLLPAKERFHDAEGYYSVALHELTHATGHESRLARPGITDPDATYGSPKYALEELVAQLGSAFLCGHFGIRNEAFDAAYIASWIQALRDDKRAIFRATGAARLAAEFLKQAYQENRAPASTDEPQRERIEAASQPRPKADDQDIELFGHQ
ncbi:zincin-like metallopeptidase domain-containing protein [Halomonas sp. McH1-25]|uniref:ArdC family protein n=1 Tax=unclassified Halomonas TaxID=2609666 RepID=UPI001EF4F1BC|nr:MULTISPECIES: zincin-like metallopeptidase domain-containing protein [unclassified Halomonas]MCG7601803.1 zincin-like metallopeptidase domain-containing protein [Halomonas sp. McH1-25]MCP1343979.1 zincin-like metallopeptidase domain-containing protein [Halomonas sp. FL8]MCP1361788.1 zincin-like metallopeptidase domain-containing protein [Halomonas sp. BBD45]MCP1364568.1 zincin-like metallopeptidase domain-containing protein [Halomonas sp. BBD48]